MRLGRLREVKNWKGERGGRLAKLYAHLKTTRLQLNLAPVHLVVLKARCVHIEKWRKNLTNTQGGAGGGEERVSETATAIQKLGLF